MTENWNGIRETIAKAAHEACQAWNAHHECVSIKHWDQLSEQRKQSLMQGVDSALSGLTPEQQHDAWCKDMRAEGWVLGLEKNEYKKTHPCLVPYEDLPKYQRAKDEIFIRTVQTLNELFEQHGS